ncbi:MAG: citryl-CoA lyase [Chloroflexi bacterium]|nr:citryl-CoA lyase [Chloroflexota bacterium]
MSELAWKTAITEIKPNEVRLRGYRIDELMGRVTMSQAVYLALTGELPTPEVGNLLDAILVSSIDHGATPPCALAARTAASTGAPLNAAVAAGLLSINRYHGGAIEDCMAVLEAGMDRARETGSEFAKVAGELVQEHRDAKKRIAGLGHRIHTEDPRTRRLFALADEAGIAAEGVEMIQALREAMAASGKGLPINVDGAIAALLIDMEMPRAIGNAFFMMARVPGLVAQVHEEQIRERPMRRIHPTDHVYDGPEARSLTE